MINDERIKRGMKPLQGKSKKTIDELDYTNEKSVPNFDEITNTISNRYPGHFHGFAGSAVLADAAGHDKTTSEATSDSQKLWDIIGAGQQQLPDIKDYHNKAFDQWQDSKPKLKQKKPDFQPVDGSKLEPEDQKKIFDSLPASALKGNTARAHEVYGMVKAGVNKDNAEDFVGKAKALSIGELWVLKNALGASMKEWDVVRGSKASQVDALLTKAGLSHLVEDKTKDVPFSEEEDDPIKTALIAWLSIDGTAEELEKLIQAALTKHSIHAEPAARYVAPTGTGRKADDRDALFALMKSAMSIGAERMSKYVRRSLTEIGIDRALRTGVLFTPRDRQALQDDLASAIATADLLGRTRVRQRAEQVYKRHPKFFSEIAAHFSQYDEPGKAAGQAPKNLSLLTPMEAYDYFTSLTPTLNVNPDRFGPLMERRAFTLAVATEKTLLEEIQKVIADSIRDGEPGGAVTIRQLMIETGTAPNNPQYAEAVYRTNVMDAAAIGHDREMQTDDMRETFPVFEYSAIVGDGRGRSWHVKKNGLLYPSNFLFTNVRGTGPEDVINCRCTPIAIDKFELADRLERGETIQASY